MAWRRWSERLHGWLAAPSLLVGAGLALVCTVDAARLVPERLNLALLGLAVAGLLIAYALGTPADVPAAPVAAATGRSPRLARLAGLLYGLGVGLAGLVVTLLWRTPLEWHGPAVGWLGSLLLLLAGAVVWDLHHGRLRLSRPRRPDWRRWWPLATSLGLVGGLALALRLYRLSEVPIGIFIDETNSAVEALAILHGAPTSPFATGWYETPSGYLFLQAVFIAWLGPTFMALKWPAILFGVGLALGTVWLGRLLFGGPTGLLAGLIVAFARWPLNMSRWGWNETAPPVVHVFSFYCLIKGIQSRRTSLFALAGLLLGLGMYTYLSIRIVALAIGGYLLWRCLSSRHFLRQHLVDLTVFGLLFLATFAPLATHYARSPETFGNRTREVTILRDMSESSDYWAPLIENTRRHLVMFIGPGDRNGRHNVPGQPMLDPILAALLAVATVRALLLWRDRRRLMLVAWIPVILLGGILTNLPEGPQAYRTLGVIPAVALLAADLLVAIGRWLQGWLQSCRLDRRLAGAVAVLALAGLLIESAHLNLTSYFGDFASSPAVASVFNPAENLVARAIAASPMPERAYVAPHFYGSSLVRYFNSRRRVAGDPRDPLEPTYRLFSGPDALPLIEVTEGSDEPVVIFWTPEWFGLASLVRTLYPSTRAEPVTAAPAGVVMERVIIPGAELQQTRGLTAQRWLADGSSEQTRVLDPSVGLSGSFERVEWRGSLFISRSGRQRLSAVNGGAIQIDGQPMDGPRFLARGLHRLLVTQTAEQARQGLRLETSGDEPGARPLAVPNGALLSLTDPPRAGLLGRYYQGDSWSGAPLFERIDPVLLFAWTEAEPVPGPFSVAWQGEIDIPADGQYIFLLEADDGARLWLDGRLVGDGTRPQVPNRIEARLTLTAGRHPIRIDYYQRGGGKGLSLRWVRPGQRPELVPADRLHPPP